MQRECAGVTRVGQGGARIGTIRAILAPARRMARVALGRGRMSAAEAETRYNLNQLQTFEALLNVHGLSFAGFSSILDFACGPARLTQHLFRLAPKAAIYGYDVDSEAVAECSRKFPGGHFYANGLMPPLEYDDEQFDLIWSYSIFTSLPEANHRAWLEELARKLRPGGVMVHTTHSYEYLKRASAFSPEALVKYKLEGSVEEFIRSDPEYYYLVHKPRTPDYGLAIISKEYASTRWPEYTGLTLMDYAEGAIESYPEGCQDIVMLAKEPRGTGG